MAKENLLITKKTGRYFILGNLDKPIKNIWIVLHGYGQLADEFIKDFEVLNNEATIIVAPEALNKFYFRGFDGKIGASWMTKNNRENEIKDYVNFISSVFNKVMSKVNSSFPKINVLGFSQGTHTAVRWLSNTKIEIDNLILWSGSFPHDCNYDDKKYWSNINCKLVFGDNDTMINKEKLNSELELFSKQKIQFEVITFNGRHEIKKEPLQRITSSF